MTEMNELKNEETTAKKEELQKKYNTENLPVGYKAIPDTEFNIRVEDWFKNDNNNHEHAVRDYKHARILAYEFKDKLRYAEHRGLFTHYSGKVWESISDERIAKIASDILQKEYLIEMKIATHEGNKQKINDASTSLKEVCTFARIQGALSFLKGWEGIFTKYNEWDCDGWKLNVNNGTIDLHDCTLHPHNPNDLITQIAPITFDPEAEGKLWEKHLFLCIPNENIRRQIARDIGLALIAGTLEEALPIWYGIGQNGKTTTMRIIQQILNDYVKKAAANILIQTKYDRHPTEIADLYNSRIVFSSEIDKNQKLAEGMVKDLTGGETKKARFMRCDFFEFKQTFHIFLLCNHKPIITGTDEGIWRRIRLIPWDVKIDDDSKLPQDIVIEMLMQESSAILNWMLAGLKDWQEDQNWIAPEVTVATSKYREESDILKPFIDDRCEVEKNYIVHVKDLYEAYQAWAENQGEIALKRRYFNSALEGQGIRQDKDREKRFWTGIRLKGQLL